MTLWHLVVREIGHRKWNFVFSLLSVVLAVGCLVGSLMLLRRDEQQTRQILAEKEKQVQQAVERKRREVQQEVARRERAVQQAGKELNDMMRKITKEMGFNIYILPARQDLNELNTNGVISETMPESYVATLAESKIMVINHLLPMLTHRIDDWQGPRKKQPVLVVGTRGEVPLSHRDPKKPLGEGQAVPPGTAVVGYQISRQQQLKKGDRLTLLGREFTVTKIHNQRGTRDDNTIWINLREAQQALGKENLIHAILALECNCASADRVGEIRTEIQKLLPGTQVLERDASKALARAEARNAAKKAAQQALQRAKTEGALAIQREKKAGEEALQKERENRNALMSQHQAFVSLLVPLVVFGCAVWIGLLSYLNVRQRTSEVGILRAIGLRSREILTVFLAKALLVGLLGAVLGYAAGWAVGLQWGETATGALSGSFFDARSLLLALIVAPLLAGLASWLPAVLAARQDPAVVLHAE